MRPHCQRRRRGAKIEARPHRLPPQQRKVSASVTSFKVIRARAEKRKGGPAALKKLLPPVPDTKSLTKLGDDRVLAEMSRRGFCAGFSWSVIEAKWSGFEAAFLGFKPATPAFKPAQFWGKLTSDTPIAPNRPKILSC